MKKSRRRKGVKRHHKARRHYSRVKRNPSFSGSGIVNSLIGVGSAGLGGVAVIKLSAAIAKLAGITSEGQKNLIRIALTLGAGYMLPKYMKSQYVKSFVDGMGAVTAVKFAETATGINLLSGDDDIDALVRNIDVQGVTEIGYDYPSSLMGAELFDESSLLGVTELNGGDDMDQF